MMMGYVTMHLFEVLNSRRLEVLQLFANSPVLRLNLAKMEDLANTSHSIIVN